MFRNNSGIDSKAGTTAAKRVMSGEIYDNLPFILVGEKENPRVKGQQILKQNPVKYSSSFCINPFDNTQVIWQATANHLGFGAF